MSTRDSYIFFDCDTAFQGEVSTDHLVLEGMITGDVLASKDVFLKQGALVQGEISTKKYTIEEGSIHQGKLRMDLTKNGSTSANGELPIKEKVSQHPQSENNTARNNGVDRTNGTNKNGAIVNGNGSYAKKSTGTSDYSSGTNEVEFPSKNGNGNHENGNYQNEDKTVFELMNNDVRESNSESETNGQFSENDYTEAPPQERLW